MNPVEEQLKRMQEKLLRLLKQHQSLLKENEKLSQEFKEMAGRYNAMLIQSEKWQQQAEILKLSHEQMNDHDKKAFEKRLSQYVKEIDRCIALLNE